MTRTKLRGTGSRARMFRFRRDCCVFGLLGAAVGALLALSYKSPEDRRSSGIMPEVVLVAPEKLQPRSCPQGMRCLPSMALYEAAERRIYLSRNWSPDDFNDLGILLHEFIHHLQVIGQLDYPCERAIELPAYELQEVFYRAHGRDPGRRVPSDFTRFTRYSCADE